MPRHSIHLSDDVRALIPPGESLSRIITAALIHWSNAMKVKDYRRAAADIAADPTASEWLKTALAQAMNRDILDAAHDAEILAAVLQARADEALGNWRRWNRNG